MTAIVAANTGSALAYGADAWSERLRARVAAVFENPKVAVFPVSSGTAANALSLSALCPPWGSVLCHESAHIIVNEAGATSMFTGGAVMKGLPGAGYRISPESLEQAFGSTHWGDPHHSQPAVLSLTQTTDGGSLLFYRTGSDEVRFVTSFQTTHADVDEALKRIAAGLGR